MLHKRIKVYLALIFSCFVFSSCEMEESFQKQQNWLKKCSEYPKKEPINWKFFEEINFDNLGPVSKKQFLRPTDQIIIPQGDKIDKYIKIKTAADGDCFVRNGNFIMLEELSFNLNDDLKLKKYSKIKNALIELWPYRKKSLGDVRIDNILRLLKRVTNVKNLNDLLELLNNPCIDMALVWLLRDLSWAYANLDLINFTKKNNIPFDPDSEEMPKIDYTQPMDDLNTFLNLKNDLKFGQDFTLYHRYDNKTGGAYFFNIWEEIFGAQIWQFKLSEAQKEHSQLLCTESLNSDSIPISKIDCKPINEVSSTNRQAIIINTSNIHCDLLIAEKLMKI